MKCKTNIVFDGDVDVCESLSSHNSMWLSVAISLSPYLVRHVKLDYCKKEKPFLQPCAAYYYYYYQNV